ncbi:MAG: hypothetical protein ABSC53_03835 [Bacteroidota bacterium]|jgi:uncharacterized integral membrane protein
MTKKSNPVISHWYGLFEGLQESPKETYQSIESAIKKRELPDTFITSINLIEGGPLSARREYLRVSRKEHVFDICVALFGKGMFVSWWLSKAQSSKGLWIAIAAFIFALILIFLSIDQFGLFLGLFLGIIFLPLIFVILGLLIREGTIMIEDSILEVPVLGTLYERFFHPITYFKIDTALMFQESVRCAVLEVIDEITKSKGIRALSESERAPIMNDIFK